MFDPNKELTDYTATQLRQIAAKYEIDTVDFDLRKKDDKELLFKRIVRAYKLAVLPPVTINPEVPVLDDISPEDQALLDQEVSEHQAYLKSKYHGTVYPSSGKMFNYLNNEIELNVDNPTDIRDENIAKGRSNYTDHLPQPQIQLLSTPKNNELSEPTEQTKVYQSFGVMAIVFLLLTLDIIHEEYKKLLGKFENVPRSYLEKRLKGGVKHLDQIWNIHLNEWNY